jgi:hypothetical protein
VIELSLIELPVIELKEIEDTVMLELWVVDV